MPAKFTWEVLNKKVPSTLMLKMCYFFQWLPFIYKPEPYEWELRAFIDKKKPARDRLFSYHEFLHISNLLKDVPCEKKGYLLFDLKISKKL